MKRITFRLGIWLIHRLLCGTQIKVKLEHVAGGWMWYIWSLEGNTLRRELRGQRTIGMLAKWAMVQKDGHGVTFTYTFNRMKYSDTKGMSQS